LALTEFVSLGKRGKIVARGFHRPSPLPFDGHVSIMVYDLVVVEPE
jgi:hypothetical protein